MVEPMRYSKFVIVLFVGGFLISTPSYALGPGLPKTPVASLSTSGAANGQVAKSSSTDGQVNTSTSYAADSADNGGGKNTVSVSSAIGNLFLTSASSAESLNNGGGSGGGQAVVNYSFIINGPTATVLVDLSAIASFYRSATQGDASSTPVDIFQNIDVSVVDSDQNVISQSVVQSHNSNELTTSVLSTNIFASPEQYVAMSSEWSQTFDGYGSITLNTGKIYNLQFSLSDQTSIGSASGSRVSTISTSISRLELAIDGSNVNSQAYSLSSLQSVPEPAMWITMVAGFGMIGLGIRRQRWKIG